MTCFKHELKKTLCAVLLATTALVSFARVAEAAPALGEARKGSVLFVSAAWGQNVPYRLRFYEQRLNEQGYETLEMPFNALSDDLIRKFNLIMFLDFALIKEGMGDQVLQTSSGYQDELAERLERYVKDGGGLLFFSMGPLTGEGGAIAQNRLLKRWGAEYLMEIISDSPTANAPTGRRGDTYYLANHIAPSPITEGVKNIWYTPHIHIDVPTTQPLKVDESWQVVVTGRPSARTQATKFLDLHARVITGEPGTYEGSPPLVALRSMGKGSIVLLSFSSLNTVFGYKHLFWEDIAMTRGDGSTASDLLKLMDNAVAYLTKPTAASGEIGGYVSLPVPPKRALQPIDWRGMGFAPAPPRVFNGVIGAHTAYSDGKGTVQEYAAAAKSAGLDYLVFTEQFTNMNPEKWKMLREDCRKASDDTFLALAGYEYRIQAGDRWIAVYDQDWPKSSILTPDGKRVKNAALFLFETLSSGFAAPFDLTHAVVPHDGLALYRGLGFITQERGKIVDDALDAYLYNARLDDLPRPIAVNLIYSPAELAAASKGILNQVRASSLEEVRVNFRNCDGPSPNWSVSSGPRITDWQGLNLIRSTAGKWMVAGTDRWRIRLEAESDVPLREVSIYDGLSLFRRYLADGKKFSVEFDGLHDQQRAFVAIVTDSKGHRAISGVLDTADELMRRFMCSDRQNSLNNACLEDAEGNEVLVGTVARFHEKGRMRPCFPGNSAEASLTTAPLLDGGGAQAGGFFFSPAIAGKEDTEGFVPDIFVGGMGSPLSSKHVIVQDWYHKMLFLDGKAARWGTSYTLWLPAEPSRLFEARLRIFDFRKYPGCPRLQLLEGRVTLKRDVTLADSPDPSLSLGDFMFQAGVAANNRFLIASPPSWKESGAIFDGQKDFSGTLDPGGYVTVGPYFSGAFGFFAVDKPLRIVSDFRKGAVRNWNGCYQGEDVHIYFGFHEPGRILKAGTTIDYRILFMAAGINGETGGDTSQFEWVRRTMGLGGEPGYTLSVKSGEVLGTKLYLELQAKDGGSSFSISKADLPIPLPIRVHGVNPNWSTGVWDEEMKTLVPCGVLDGAAYGSIDTRKRDHSLYVGNLLICDQPEVRLTLLPEPDSHWTVQANNPTNKRLTTVIRSPSGFSGLKGLKRKLVLEPGSDQKFLF